MDKIKVSVIMPSLNVVNYIDECIVSVLNQTLHDIEIICVDAGSTDGTLEKLQRYAEDHQDKDRITLIISEVKSYGYQVNLGIERARGEYIAIVETDDYIDSKMYENLYTVAQKTQCDYVKANFSSYWTTLKGKRIVSVSNTLAKLQLEYNEVINVPEHPELLQADTNVWSGIYSRKFLMDNCILFNESKGAAFQDIGFLQLVHWKATTAIYVREPYYYYCTDRDSSSTNSGRGLVFAFQEYQKLFMVKEKELLSVNQITSLYARMFDVFVENVCKLGSYKTAEENREIIDWFINEFNKTSNNIGWEEIKELLRCNEEKVEDREDFIHWSVGKKIVIFGSGIWGRNCYKTLDNATCEIIGFADNNTKLEGETIGELVIHTPAYYVENNPKVYWVIANQKYAQEMAEQLVKTGIENENIYLFSHAKG